MAKYTGKDLIVQFGGNDISARRRTLDTNEAIELPDASVGGEAFQDHLTGQTSFGATYTCLDATDGSVIWGYLDPGTEGTLEWAPEGTASGKIRHYVTATVESRDPSYGYNTPVEFSVTFKGRSAVTDTVY